LLATAYGPSEQLFAPGLGDVAGGIALRTFFDTIGVGCSLDPVLAAITVAAGADISLRHAGTSCPAILVPRCVFGRSHSEDPL